MPRILPRLLSRLSQSQSPQKFDSSSLKTVKRPAKSLRKPVPLPQSLNPADHSQSILLTPKNQITSSRDYVQHKSLPPRVHVGKRAEAAAGSYDKSRSMSKEELKWWSSPYLRMLSSPIRRCMVTDQYLPSDFLIRLGAFKIPSSIPRFLTPNRPPEAVLVPDGLEHSRFRVRETGKAGYVLCWKNAIPLLRQKGQPYIYFLSDQVLTIILFLTGSFRRIAHNSRIPSSVEQQVKHLLCLRVLQELQLVIDRLRFRAKQMAGHTVVRRLTRSEWQKFNTEGVLDVPNALAVIVVPPLNRNTGTKNRPEPSMSAFPPESSLEVERKRPDLPVSVLHSQSSPHPSLDSKEVTDLATHQVPLYHGASMFPDPGQRAALHKLLCRILSLERVARYKKKLYSASGDSASHAFVLMSDKHTTKSADVAAVCIALWRLRMFEGLGWENNPGWITHSKYRSVERYE
ncbi:hypothetical protein D9758_001197 [Tetrapyrgos nigripes]|uniref:Uncharacterized protein n=1 Tax=Tetrapyrgos nigripes TaxID=182062 RepID=A0A8H5GRM8_9AGAR|nr:hypothetical protein D9758_001197 [Tetrapyrgos nigripes]